MAKVVETELVRRLKDDRDLMSDEERKMRYLSYANLYDGSLLDNIRLTSVELDAKYATMDPSSWQEFLRYPSVKRYITGYLEEIAEKKAALVLTETAGSARDALNIKKDIHERNKGEDNSQVVVFFMPQKKYKGLV